MSKKDDSKPLAGTALIKETCREVVRDSSGRVVQTVERRKTAGGTERAVMRDASGRITGTATTRSTGGKDSNTANTNTAYRDASGRLTPDKKRFKVPGAQKVLL